VFAFRHKIGGGIYMRYP